jgi:hypothetical protein
MAILRVEELEQRHLLSGGFFRSAAPAPSYDHGGWAAWFSPPPMDMQIGGPRDGYGRQFGPPAGEYSGPLRDGGRATNGPLEAGPVVRLSNSVIEAAPEGQNVARLADSRATLPVVDAPNPDRGANAATATARFTVSSQTPLLLSVLATVPSVVTPRIGVSLSPGSTTGFGGEGTGVVPATTRSVTPNSGSAVIDSPAAGTLPKDRNSKSFPPIGPGLLSILPGVDLQSLSRGLREFLARIERSAEHLVEDGDGIRPWIMAGAAAVVASEIARRQLRRHGAAANKLPNPFSVPDFCE